VSLVAIELADLMGMMNRKDVVDFYPAECKIKIGTI